MNNMYAGKYETILIAIVDLSIYRSRIIKLPQNGNGKTIYL